MTETDQTEELIARLRRVYSATAVDHILSPRNFGSMPNPDGVGSVTEGDCGDTLSVWLRVRDDVIREAAFWTNGCAATIACGSMGVELIEGRPVIVALGLDPEEILAALDGLPEANAHCAATATAAVRAAVCDYLRMKREPWRKAYRR